MLAAILIYLATGCWNALIVCNVMRYLPDDSPKWKDSWVPIIVVLWLPVLVCAILVYVFRGRLKED